MSWFLLAIIGHLSNAIAFVVDKTLLNSTFKRSATYAALIGGFSFVALLAATALLAVLGRFRIHSNSNGWPIDDLVPLYHF